MVIKTSPNNNSTNLKSLSKVKGLGIVSGQGAVKESGGGGGKTVDYE